MTYGTYLKCLKIIKLDRNLICQAKLIKNVIIKAIFWQAYVFGKLKNYNNGGKTNEKI